MPSDVGVVPGKSWREGGRNQSTQKVKFTRNCVSKQQNHDDRSRESESASDCKDRLLVLIERDWGLV